jgi:hypothetical protein
MSMQAVAAINKSTLMKGLCGEEGHSNDSDMPAYLVASNQVLLKKRPRCLKDAEHSDSKAIASEFFTEGSVISDHNCEYLLGGAA